LDIAALSEADHYQTTNCNASNYSTNFFSERLSARLKTCSIGREKCRCLPKESARTKIHPIIQTANNIRSTCQLEPLKKNATLEKTL